MFKSSIWQKLVDIIQIPCPSDPSTELNIVLSTLMNTIQAGYSSFDRKRHSFAINYAKVIL